MIKGEGLQIDNSKAECLDPESAEYYKFFGIEKGDGQLDEKAKERVIEEYFKRVESLRNTELYERNMIKALNTMCMSAVMYVMNIVNFSRPELERRGLLSFEYIYNMAKIRISNYLSHTEDPLLQTVFNREQAKTNSKSIARQAEVAFQDVRMKVKFYHNKIQVNGEDINGNHKQTARKLKTLYQNKYQERLEKTYKEKKVQSKIWSDITKSGKSIENFKWIRLNMTPEKIGQIIRIQEQMILTRTFLQMQGKHQETTCRLCEAHPEGIMHWKSACPYFAGHNQALKVFCVALAKKVDLLDPKLAWFNVRIAPVIENDEASIHWNIKMATHTTVEHCWPDLRVEWKKKQLIEVFDMACPLDYNVIEKEKEKIRNYSQLCYDLRRQNPTHKVVFHPLVIGATRRLNSIRKEINIMIDEIKVTDSIVREMQKTVVVYTQQMIHRILTGLL